MLGPHMLGDQHVVQHRKRGKQPDILKCPGHPHMGDLIWGGGQFVGEHPLVLPLVGLFHLALGEILHHRLPQKRDPSVGGLVDPGDAVEGRGLARAIGADQRHDFSLVYLQGQVIDRYHASKLHGDVL